MELDSVHSESKATTKETSRTAPKALLSCELCRTRKVKCDKAWPSCSTCTRAGIKCVIVNRQRLPRGRNGGRRKVVDADLKARVGRLENLVKTLGTGPNKEESLAAQDFKQAIESRYESLSRDSRATELGCSNTSDRNEPADLSKYLGSHFWLTLSEEVSGLREALDQSSDEEGDSQDHSSFCSDPSSTDFQSRDFGYIICGPESFIIGPESLKHPPLHVIQLLCSVYFRNVDPICKILHRPSVHAYLVEGKPYLDHRPGDPAVEALSFAIYFSALTSQTDIETNVQFGEDKQTLLNRFRFAAQVSLARADLINTTNLTTLQAFTVLLAAVRTQDSSRFSWTLIALAIRIAKAIGLDTEVTRITSKPFETEMRRRLWHVIHFLEHHAAFDRGTVPVGFDEKTTLPLPLNVNDDDFSPQSTAPLRERKEFTDTTFSLMCIDASLLSRRLSLFYPGSDSQENDNVAFKANREGVEAFKVYIEDRYLRHCDITIPLHWFTKTVGEIMVAGGTLFSVRPMRRHAPYLPSGVDREGVLDLGIKVLELQEKLAREPNVAPWRWHLWIQWHALAVVFTELCSQTRGPLVDRAWRIAEISFEKYAKTIADSSKGLLWKPMEKLRKTAMRHRKSVTPLLDRTLQQESPLEQVFALPPVEISQSEVGVHQSRSSQAQNTDYVLPQNPIQFDTKSFEWWPTLFSNDENLADQIKNTWTAAPSDMAFTNWDNFVEEFEDVSATTAPQAPN